MSADFAAHIEVVARRLLGEPNRALSSRTQWRYGSHGSFAVELDKGTWFDFERNEGGGVLDLIYRKTGLADGAAVEWLASELGIRLDERPEPGPQRPIVATYDYRDEAGALLFQVVRFDPKDFRQRRPDGNGGWIWSTKGVRQVPYRLAALLERPEGAPIFIQEGEKDCDPLAKLGLVATCNAGGAGKWRPELNEHFRGAVVYSLPDNDDPGRDHARQVAKNLHGIASAVRIVQLPGLPLKGDVGDWLAAGGTREQLIELCEAAPLWEPAAEDADPVFVPKPFKDLAKGDIPPRQWLLGTILCRRFVTVLAARGGTGKTTLLIAWAISLGTGRDLTGDYVHKRSRVLLLTFEDDLDEYRRRLRAALMHHDISEDDVEGCCLINLTGLGITLATAAKDGTFEENDVSQRIVRMIRRHRFDVAMFDPFVKLSETNENDNRAADFIVNVLVRIAIETNIAVLLAHHFRKGSAEPGNMDSARGAGSAVDASRAGLTLVPMSTEEAQTLGVPEDERRRLVRLDDGKVNLVLAAEKARWFRLASVAIGNATDDYPHGDNVQTVERWQPPDMWLDLTPSLCCRIIYEIDAGMEDGERYSGKPQATVRGAWKVVMAHAPKLTDKQARRVIATWLQNGVLQEREYRSEADRKEYTGLFANPAKRPGGYASG